MIAVMDSSLWYRTFTRGAKPEDPDQPLDDIDTVADNEFIQSHFTDKFGQWLTQGNNKLQGTLDDLLSIFFQDSANFKLQTYLVGDGTSIPKEKQNKWFKSHLRLVCVVTPPSINVVENFAAVPWLFFVVGSHYLTNQDAFLQVASWDGTTFRFYQRDEINGQTNVKGWIYQGESNDAFSDAGQYLGPFNGHVNGACIMKEIHQPWTHWLSPTDNLANCFSSDDITAFKNAPYLTKLNDPSVLGGATVKTADFLEPLILSGVQAWFKQRQKNDFFDEKGQLLTQPHNIKRWVAHLLLTTTINIAGASNQGFVVPPDHFLDNELLILQSTFDLADGINVPNFAFDGNMYAQARTELGLCLMQELDPDDLPPIGTFFWLPVETLGEGREPKKDQIPFMIARDDEGVVPFTILQSSIEDRFGAATMQNLKAGKTSLQLFSESTVNALLMVDFWNPIYSWRRGRLMQYITETTTLTGNTYDLEANFIAAVKASHAFKDQSSPEYAFVQLLSISTDDFQTRIQSYLDNVSKRLKKYDGLHDYMILAESRRRIYRPLPLDEFGFTLPYARNLDPSTPWYEMTEQGTIQPIPQEGVDFLKAWIGSLAGFDPKLLNEASSKKQSMVHPALLPKPANLPVLCQSARSPNGRAKSQGCPYFANRRKSSVKSIPGIATLAQFPSSATMQNLGNADTTHQASEHV